MLLLRIGGKQEVEAEEGFQDANVYREWAIRLTHLGKYRDAIGVFQKSLKFAKQDDVRTLVGYCNALSEFTRYIEANEIATKALNIAPNNYQVKFLKVHTLFKIGEFGYSLIHSHDGLRKRKMPFEWGVYQAIEAVNNCVGKNTSPVALWLLHPWIQKLEEHREYLISRLGEEEDEFEGIGEDESKFKVNDKEAQREAYLKKLHHLFATKILGELAVDKFFAEYLMDNPNLLKSHNKESGDWMIYYVARTHKKSCYRQDIMRTRMPLYVSIFEKRKIPLGHRCRMNYDKNLRKQNIVIKADFLLRKLFKARMTRDYIRFFSLVDRIKDEFDSYSKRMFPERDKCLDEVYKMVARVYVDTRNVTCFEDELSKDIFLKHHLGIHVTSLPRQTDIAWVRTANKKKAMKVFKRRLAMAYRPLELAWLFHEFTKYLTEIRRFDLARFYAKKALEKAVLAKNVKWALNSHHLMMKMEMDQRNKNEAKEYALLALSCAQKLGIDFLIDFYERIVKMLEDSKIDKFLEIDGISVRQQMIIRLMPEDMKSEVDFLLRAMNSMPTERRMSIMPGYEPRIYETKLPSKRKSIKMIPPKDRQMKARLALFKEFDSLKKRKLGYIDFDKY
ncbi:outer dynein arm-docking complex subunit 4-like [Prorops nasuta]|uniref:outer dynein arm-docking complex subunit 4-like n=1 Tax=Prorops nasuta TaxID=863751 RepID=UPI0034CE2F35